MVAQACHSSYLEAVSRRFKGCPGQKVRPYSKNNLKQKGLDVWLKCRRVAKP
jgi:hypothetical protein